MAYAFPFHVFTSNKSLRGHFQTLIVSPLIHSKTHHQFSVLVGNANPLIHDYYTQDWEVGMYQNLDALWSQKTCPEPDRLFKVLGELETRIQGKDEEMIYPEVCVPIGCY